MLVCLFLLPSHTMTNLLGCASMSARVCQLTRSTVLRCAVCSKMKPSQNCSLPANSASWHASLSTSCAHLANHALCSTLVMLGFPHSMQCVPSKCASSCCLIIAYHSLLTMVFQRRWFKLTGRLFMCICVYQLSDAFIHSRKVGFRESCLIPSILAIKALRNGSSLVTIGHSGNDCRCVICGASD